MLAALTALWAGAGCRSEAPAELSGRAYWSHSPSRCRIDEVREYHCDSLLPRESSLPAPEPYADCPGTIESHGADHDPPPPVAVFDASYTEHVRRRAPPGHDCCYSWCSPLRLADPRSPSAVAACRTPAAFRETYCMAVPESGTSMPSAPPFQACPAAILPPARAVFAVPEAALFDAAFTAERHQSGFAECCYAWCAQAPPTSGLEGR